MKLREMAMPGLHDKVETILKQMNLKRDIPVLVLGSGEGAFEKRLVRMGFTNITSVDLYTKNKMMSKVRFMKLDLNEKNFSEKIGNQYDLIICVEILEHLNSTPDFLRNTRRLLSQKGVLLISTPNPHSNLSRIDNLLIGSPTLFIGKPAIGGHINPVFLDIFRFHCEQNLLKIVKIENFGTLKDYIKAYDKRSLKSKAYILLLSLLYFILNPLMILNRNKYLSNIFLLRK
jgi:2-polyprenyl-3-methyl-5-hydroxy-6-metoxy-1,4-benzoquinol methylase